MILQVLRCSSLSVWVIVLAALLAVPILVVLGSVFWPQPELWQHLRDTVLADYVWNSLRLALGAGVLAGVLGTTLAWYVARYEFFGRSVLQWVLLLPMAIPAYIMAYSYTGLLDFAGPIQTQLRAIFGWSYGDYYFPEIRSLGGAVLMLSLVLYPYVYLLARAAFSEQSSSLLEASRTLGWTPKQHFWKVALPMARPAILTGMALVMMEALADYGTVQYFGVTTFTTGIFRTWFGMGNPLGAAQLAALLCSVVLVLLYLEQRSRQRLKFYQPRQSTQVSERLSLMGFKHAIAVVLCLLPLLLGFVLPAGQLFYWSLERLDQLISPEFLRLCWHSFSLACLTSIVVCAVALLFAYGRRLNPHWLLQWPVRLSAMGYALPGTVIAIGVMMPLAALDNQLDAWAEHWFGVRLGLLFSGTLVALVLAYSLRFLAVALHGLEAGLGRITPSMDQAARSLGASPTEALVRVHLPLLRSSLLVAVILVFVDVLKELPATLLLRPFNFNTLSVRAYELASDERLADAALPALSIVLVGLLPVVLLSKALDKSRKSPI
ncbi:iron(III) transport system permease protein [Azomonas agilis]|uniref:Iron(III) transport system permease protein n=1 Tax=Azomonas agilis TaxID=116849 RepID=A0A562J3S0_9GAMM|nr:iron ABC transporter permease [Azomonas agilis]TWH77504.1 iron(III) transport system permease protein [Azomonas agilis]